MSSFLNLIALIPSPSILTAFYAGHFRGNTRCIYLQSLGFIFPFNLYQMFELNIAGYDKLLS